MGTELNPFLRECGVVTVGGAGLASSCLILVLSS